MAPSTPAGDHTRGCGSRMNVRLRSFLCCVTALLLVEGSVVRAEDQVVQCAETKVKGAMATTGTMVLSKEFLY